MLLDASQANWQTICHESIDINKISAYDAMIYDIVLSHAIYVYRFFISY
jgi:hypothetical protein